MDTRQSLFRNVSFVANSFLILSASLSFSLSFFFLSTKVGKLPDWLGTFFEEPVDFLCLHRPRQSSKMHVRLNGDYIESGVDIVSAINQ